MSKKSRDDITGVFERELDQTEQSLIDTHRRARSTLSVPCGIKRLLIVTRDHERAAKLAKQLAAAGISPEFVSSAEIAERVVSQMPFDCVLADPEFIHGLQKTLGLKSKIVILNGKPDQLAVEEARQACFP